MAIKTKVYVNMQPRGKSKSQVEYFIVDEEHAGQRIDNFLIARLKGVPKSRIYRILRKGEVRVNSKRISPLYRLREGDNVRLPPLFLDEAAKQVPPSKATETILANRILYEDEYLLVINKPSGMSVHAGSTVRVGVIEAMKHLYPHLPQLELAHRLDSETSGCLVLAKKKRILREIHTLLRAGQVKKIYWALTQGKWKQHELRVDVPLQKEYKEGGKKHVVEVRKDGKQAVTIFHPIKAFQNATLVQATLLTGRTHQIRVHAQFSKHPIAADDRYGDPEFNKEARAAGVKRMFLHARSIEFILPSTGQRIKVEAPLDADLESALENFK